jgi:hypothetical protein
VNARASIWFGAVLRGDLDTIEIGEESNVQDNVVLHTDTGMHLVLGRRVPVGHGTLVHGASGPAQSSLPEQSSPKGPTFHPDHWFSVSQARYVDRSQWTRLPDSTTAHSTTPSLPPSTGTRAKPVNS